MSENNEKNLDKTEDKKNKKTLIKIKKRYFNKQKLKDTEDKFLGP